MSKEIFNSKLSNNLLTIYSSAAKYLNVLLLSFGLSFIFLSCNNVQMKIDSAKAKIEDAEKKGDSMTQEDYDELEITMSQLQTDMENNRSKYSEEQIKYIGELQGRHKLIVLKKIYNDLINSLKDAGYQLDGVIKTILTPLFENAEKNREGLNMNELNTLEQKLNEFKKQFLDSEK
jgi:hypothetical protein